jgi:hypothetical protein
LKLYIDDLRAPPDTSWTVARTSQEAMALLVSHLSEITHISFDHDLGGDDTTRPVAAYLEEMRHGLTPFPIETTIHSANPVGRAWLVHALSRSTIYRG